MPPTMILARVTGPNPIRDALTRESAYEGDEVVLIVREPTAPGARLPRCPRHPKRDVVREEHLCICHATLIGPLVETGAIEVLGPYEPEAAKKGSGSKAEAAKQ